jgi:ribosomal protein L37AE/L43A
MTDKFVCETCGREVVPVEGVSAVWERGYWWCAHCVSFEYVDGSTVVKFPSAGKLLPNSIMSTTEGE